MSSKHTLYTRILQGDEYLYTAVNLKKIPNQEVYVYEGKDPLVILDSVDTNNIPFTLLLTNADLIVQ